MEVSEALERLGSPGLFQLILYISLVLCNSTTSMNHLIMAVYGYTALHHCKLPSGKAKNVSIPMEKNGKYSSCKQFTDFNRSSGESVYCTNGWEFQINRDESSIVDEWILVCDEKYLVSAATTIYFAGVMLGGAIFGQIADRFGRRPVLLACMYGHIVLGFSLYFVPSYEAFAALRFFIGFLIQGLQTTSYVLLVEMTVMRYRPLIAGIFEVFWAVGSLWMASLAWMLQDWRRIQLALCLPSLVTLFWILFVPESVRWLIMKKKQAKAEEIVKRIAEFNKVSLPKDLELYVKNAIVKKDGQLYSFHDLFRTPNIRKRTLLMGYIWLASSIGYYGLSLGARGLSGDRYINLFVSSLVELIAFILVIFVLKYLNRRQPLMLYYLLGGITCIIAGVVKNRNIENAAIITRVFAITGKFFMAAGFSTIFLFTVELFPTVVRTIGMGSCVFWARVGGMLAPQILLIGKYTFSELPYLIFGSLALLAAIATYFIAETRGIPLPDTIESIEKKDGKLVQQEQQREANDTKL